jgi:hypothetical protein
LSNEHRRHVQNIGGGGAAGEGAGAGDAEAFPTEIEGGTSDTAAGPGDANSPRMAIAAMYSSIERPV